MQKKSHKKPKKLKKTNSLKYQTKPESKRIPQQMDFKPVGNVKKKRIKPVPVFEGANREPLSLANTDPSVRFGGKARSQVSLGSLVVECYNPGGGSS